MRDDEPVDPSAPTAHSQDTLEASAQPGPLFACAPGEQIGKFVVEGTLGHGAMGVVFAAFDPDLDRKVALKLVRRPGDDAGSPRLLREARAMAKISHPNVLAIHEVGTYRDQVFLAMEYAAGGTLREWCRAEPRAWRDIVGKFAQAGKGLAAAHDAGLVHRDFKPENVLLASDGVVRVADFGIVGVGPKEGPTAAAPSSATPLEPSLTQTGTMIGTPAYMAPEQHRCEDIGPAADQFAFCVALWEALYGVRPFEGTTYGQLAVNVLADHVVAPPAEREVPPWLHDVVRRGLRTPVDARWPSMRALVAALEHDPVAARRRRVAFAGAIAAFVALAGVAAFALLRGPAASRCDDVAARLTGVWDAARKQQLHAAFAQTKRWYADDTYERVAARFDEYAREWIAARSEACRIDELHADESPRIACLETRLADLRELVSVLSHAPAVAVLDQAPVATDRLLPVSACSDPATLAALTVPADRAQSEKIATLRQRGAAAGALEIAGRHGEALAAVTQLVAEAEQVGYVPELATLLGLRATIETQLGDFASAEATLRRTLELAAEAHDDALVARTWSTLILVVGNFRHRPAEALQMRIAAEAALRRAGRTPEAEGGLLLALGYVLVENHQESDAEASFDAALALFLRAHGPDDLRSGIVLQALGAAALERKDAAKAAERLTHALAILEKRLGSQHPMLEGVYYARAKALMALGRHADAVHDLERSVELARKQFGDASAEVATRDRRLGYELLVLHRTAEARPHLEQALAIRMHVLGAAHENTLGVQQLLAEVALAEGKPADARAALESVLAGLDKAEPGSLDVADCLHDLAEAQLALHDPSHARDAARRALDLGEAKHATAATLASTRFLLARALWDTGDHAGARAAAKQARDAIDPLAPTLGGLPQRDGDQLAAAIDAWLANH